MSIIFCLVRNATLYIMNHLLMGKIFIMCYFYGETTEGTLMLPFLDEFDDEDYEMVDSPCLPTFIFLYFTYFDSYSTQRIRDFAKSIHVELKDSYQFVDSENKIIEISLKGNTVVCSYIE